MGSLAVTFIFILVIVCCVSAAHVDSKTWKIQSASDGKSSDRQPRSNDSEMKHILTIIPRKFDSPEDKFSSRAWDSPCGYYPLAPGETITIQSKDYPNKYPRRNKCTWLLQGTCPESNMSITCSVFKLRKCKISYMLISGKDFRKRYCGKEPPFTETIAHNTMKVFFRSLRKRGAGFVCTVTASVPEKPTTSTDSTSSTTPTLESSSTLESLTTIKSLTTFKSSTPSTTIPSGNEMCKCGRRNPVTKIVGGQESTMHEYPWQVALTSMASDKPYCGGSIISDTWILTAAHCVEGDSPSAVYVVIGEHDWTSVFETTLTQKIQALDICIHDDYDDYTYDNDIALIELSTPITFPINNKIAPICLPDAGNLYENVVATVTGWGDDSSGGDQTFQLFEVMVPTMTNSNCQNSYGDDVTNNMICAGLDTGGIDSCQGDSGGPMVTGGNCDQTFMVQIGIVSWGIGCARPGRPGVYTRVTNYIDWINEKINGSDTCPRP